MAPSPRRVIIRHHRNTANNAFFNHLILTRGGWRSQKPIDLEVQHAMSFPAWEEIDFAPTSYEWVETPNWETVPAARQINRKGLHYAALRVPVQRAAGRLVRAAGRSVRAAGRLVRAAGRSVRAAGRLVRAAGRLVRAGILTSGRSVLQIADLGTRILRREKVINLAYGVVGGIRSKTDFLVTIEHGNLRWLRSQWDSDDPGIAAFRKQLASSRALLVTNLDPPSLATAELVMPSRWAAFPHPYFFAEGSAQLPQYLAREALQNRLDADYLVFWPSSQNWKLDFHNKGSDLAWHAASQIRREGFRLGLVVSEWGLDIAEAKRLCANLGLEKHVLWIPPLPRLRMLALLREVDLCWDQFVIQAFGGIALRAVEAGTALVGQGLTEEAQSLTGFQVPWYVASTTAEIVGKSIGHFEECQVLGRESVSAGTGALFHSWFRGNHHPNLVAEMQLELLSRIESEERVVVEPDLWAKTARKLQGVSVDGRSF